MGRRLCGRLCHRNDREGEIYRPRRHHRFASSRFRNCTASGASASHTSNGIVSSQASISSRAHRSPCGAITLISVKCPRSPLRSCVRCESSILRALWGINAAWFFSERKPTTASKTASLLRRSPPRPRCRSSAGGYTASHKPKASCARHWPSLISSGAQ